MKPNNKKEANQSMNPPPVDSRGLTGAAHPQRPAPNTAKQADVYTTQTRFLELYRRLADNDPVVQADARRDLYQNAHATDTHARDIALYGGATGDGADGFLVLLVKIWLLASLIAVIVIIANALIRALA